MAKHFCAKLSSINCQFNVVNALILREIYTIYGHAKLGYLWVLIQSVFSIAIFWALRVFLNAKAPHGLSIISYLIAGFSIWNIVSDTINKSLKAIDGNKAILTFPHVTTFDILFARVIVISMTQILCLVIILLFDACINQHPTIPNFSIFIGAIFIAFFLALGLGTFFSALAFYIPAIHNILPLCMRILFFVSGIFFSVSMFSKKIGDFLLWNPIMQLIELMRTSMSVSYKSPYVDVSYLVFIAFTALTLGLLLERYTRKRQQS